MAPEHRFVLADFTWLGRNGRLHTYEAGRHYPMPAAVAHVAAKRDLVARGKPVHWQRPSLLTPPVVLTEIEVAEAEAELRQLEQHAREPVSAVETEPGPRADHAGGVV